MNPAARAYYDTRLWGVIAAVGLAVVGGGFKLAFGTGRAHVVVSPAASPVLRVDGQPVEWTTVSAWHRTASLPRGNHRLELELLGDVVATTTDVRGDTELLLPLKGQCIDWYAYVPAGRGVSQPQLFKRVDAPTLIPDGALFGDEVAGASGPPSAAFDAHACE